MQAYDFARANATDLALARYRVDSSEAQKDVAMGRILPQVNLFGQWSENKVAYDAGLFSRDEDYPGERYGVQVKQPLFNVAAGQEVRRFSKIYEQSQEELAVAESDLLIALAEAFLTVLLADAELEQLQSELTALEGQLDDANALYERNLIPIMEVLETQTRVDSVRADVIQAKGEAAVSREELVKLTGERGADPLPIEDNVALISSFSSPEEVVVRAANASPEISAAEAALEAAKRGVDRERGKWFPEIDFTYSYQYSDVGFDNLASPPRDTTTIALGFNYPLFEGGAGVARVRGAWAEYYAAQTQLEAVQRDLEARARSSWLNLQALSERLLASRQAVKSAQINVDATRKATKAGTARPSDILVALAQNTRAKRNASAAKFQFAAGWLEVELAAGSDPILLAPTLSRALHGH
jgi:outer membrane protein